MKGYPKHIATKEDYIYLLSMPEYKNRTLDELQDIVSANDSTTTVATTLINPDDPESGYNTELIENPMPLWKQKRFSSLQDVIDTIVTYT